MSLRYKYLLKVEPGENNNKYYKMQENSDGTFTSTYGRVGAAKPQSKTYPIKEWDATLREKLAARKGYEDQTELFAEIKTAISGPTVIADDTTVANLIIALQGYAKANTAQTYLVKAENVTRAQVDKAQTIIDELVDLRGKGVLNVLDEFNKKLLDLFKTIPRIMEQVGSHLVYADNGYFDAKTKKFVSNGKAKTMKVLMEEIDKIISEEQSNLDTMASQVISQQPSTATTTQNKSLIESLGLKISSVTDRAELADIKSRAQEHGKRVLNAFKLENITTQKIFDSYVSKASEKKTELFWHGSRNQNWWWIIQQGLKIRPSNAVHTGSMFDDGVYFAVEADKSMGYTDSGRWVRGNSGNRVYMALYNVHVGKQLIINRHDSSCYTISKKVKSTGYDSVWAKKGPSLMRDEFIVYNSDQSTIKYLIEFSN